MRTTPILVITTAAALVAAGFVAAARTSSANATEAPDDAPEKQSAKKAKGERATDGSRDPGLQAQKKAIWKSAKENRTEILDARDAAMHTVRERYLEKKAAAIEACRAAGPDDGPGNATLEEKRAYAKCVKMSLTPLKTEARAGMKEARDDARAEMAALKAWARSVWKALKSEARGT